VCSLCAIVSYYAIVILNQKAVLLLNIITAYVLCYFKHGGVDLMGLKPNRQDPIFLPCFDTVGWVI